MTTVGDVVGVIAILGSIVGSTAKIVAQGQKIIDTQAAMKADLHDHETDHNGAMADLGRRLERVEAAAKDLGDAVTRAGG